MDWRLGKIGKLLCSEKGEVRSAEIIIIKNGRKLKLQRAVNKLYPFECSTGKDKMKLKFVKDNDTKMIKLWGGVFWIRRLCLNSVVWALSLCL